MNTKKNPAKKRAYKKRKNLLPLVEERTPELVPVKVTNKDTEVECLATICSILDNFNPDQRKRTLEYICGKYYDFS